MPNHLLTVWNPAYADDALDAHLRVLLRWAERSRDPQDDASPDDVYVWWAKIKSPNRDQPLPHAADVVALQKQIDAGEETHLYLTDYRSLYVGHLGEVTAEDVLADTPGEAEHTPSYMKDHDVDFWFRVFDLRRLVADDTPEVIGELRRLRNTRYHDHPVSLYGGMVDLPLIVTRDDGARWFADRSLLTSGRLWAERDAELRADTQRLARDLPDNLFGRELWERFEAATRSFLASGEATFRARRDDPSYDFSGPAMEYAKAVETELNATLFPGLRRVLEGKAPKDREVRWEGKPLDLAGPVPHQTLGAMAHLLEHDDVVKRALGAAFNDRDAGWLRGLPLELKGVVEARNAAAHAGAVPLEQASKVRARVLGIGEEGLLVRLVGVKGRAG
jgi:hypothetical protein